MCQAQTPELKMKRPEFDKPSGTLGFLNRSCLNLVLSGGDLLNREINQKTAQLDSDCWSVGLPNSGTLDTGV